MFMTRPFVYLDDESTTAEPGATAAATETTPAAATTETATTTETSFPWDKAVGEKFADADTAKAVSEFMRETYQPYVTGLQQSKAELEGKSWVFDGLNDKPLETFTELATDIFGESVGTRISTLLSEGESLETATAQATAEDKAGELEADGTKTEVELPADVKEMVEWAKAERARQSELTATQTAEAAQAEATELYDTWRKSTLEAHPDVKESVLHHYVIANVEKLGDDGQPIGLDGALAAYRADFPAPAVAKTPPPATVRGQGAGLVQPSRRMSTLADAASSVFDAARGSSTDQIV